MMGSNIQATGGKIGRTGRHIALVSEGKREGSSELYAALRRELGEAGWAFVTGATSTLDAALFEVAPLPAHTGAAA